MVHLYRLTEVARTDHLNRSASKSFRIRTTDATEPISASGARHHGFHLAALERVHGLGVSVGAGGACVRARRAARSRAISRLVELRVHCRRRVDQRDRPARSDVKGLLSRRDQEPSRSRGRRPGNLDVAPRWPKPHGGQPAAAREPQGEEADLASAPPAGAAEKGPQPLPRSARLPVEYGRRLPHHGGAAGLGASPRRWRRTRRAARDRGSAHPP